MNLNLLLRKVRPKNLIQTISVGLVFCQNNYRTILSKIFLPQIIAILIIYLIFLIFHGQFNLTFFISDDGKVFPFISFVTFLIVQSITIYQSLKLTILQNLNITGSKNFAKIFGFNIVRFSLLLPFAILWKNVLYFIAYFIVFLIVYPYLYLELFKIFGEQMEVKSDNVKNNALNYLVYTIKSILILRLLWFLMFSVILLSILLPWEFLRILTSNELFFYMYDRLLELEIVAIIALLILLLFNSIHYILIFISLKNYMYLLEGVYLEKLIHSLNDSDKVRNWFCV